MEKKYNKPDLSVRVTIAFLTAFFLSLFILPVQAADETIIPCEVLEVSGSAKIQSGLLKKVHFMVIHHANAADRERLSKWLKENSGTEVEFSLRQQTYTGILYRVAHCFGRGLLLYTDQIDVKGRDIINVTLDYSRKQ